MAIRRRRAAGITTTAARATVTIYGDLSGGLRDRWASEAARSGQVRALAPRDRCQAPLPNQSGGAAVAAEAGRTGPSEQTLRRSRLEDVDVVSRNRLVPRDQVQTLDDGLRHQHAMNGSRWCGGSRRAAIAWA